MKKIPFTSYPLLTHNLFIFRSYFLHIPIDKRI